MQRLCVVIYVKPGTLPRQLDECMMQQREHRNVALAVASRVPSCAGQVELSSLPKWLEQLASALQREHSSLWRALATATCPTAQTLRR